MDGFKPAEVCPVVAVEKSEALYKLLDFGDPGPSIAYFPCRGTTPLKSGVEGLLNGYQRFILNAYRLLEPSKLVVKFLLFCTLLIKFRLEICNHLI